MTGVQLSRSRPYQKNDNRHVEQKNDTLVRQYFGELRLDTPEQIAAGNALYERMWLYYNLFQPVMHLTEKTVEGDKVRRKWDEAQTPYQRLLATGVLSQEQQERLQALYEQTNPLLLREEIYAGLGRPLGCGTGPERDGGLMTERSWPQPEQRRTARGSRRPCSRAGPP